MRLALLLAAAVAAWGQDAQEIVRRSVKLDDQNSEIARRYTFVERAEERRLAADGRIKKREISTYDVTLLEGEVYRRLIRRNDEPLPPEDERKEQEKLRKSIERRRKETRGERERRLAEAERERQRWRELLGQLPDAFDFRLLGRERIDGRELYVIGAEPRAGFTPSSRTARLFRKMRGKLWIQVADYHWVKAEAEVIDTISFGLFLARLHKDSRFSFEQTRVNGEVWLPRRLEVRYSARIAGLARLRREMDVTYSDYRKFQSDSRVVSVQAPADADKN